MTLFAVLNFIHLSKQILPNNAQSRGGFSARSNRVIANSLHQKLKACFLEYTSKSILGSENKKDESTTMRQCRKILTCIWIQLTGIHRLRQSLYMKKRHRGSTFNGDGDMIQRVIQERSENEKEVSREDTKGNTIDQLLLRKRSNGITAKRSNGYKKEPLGPPFSISRFGK